MKLIYINLENANERGAIGTHTAGIVNGFSNILNEVFLIVDEPLDNISNNVRSDICNPVGRKIEKRIKKILLLKRKLKYLFSRARASETEILYTRFHFWFTPVIVFLVRQTEKTMHCKIKIIIEYNDIISEQIDYMLLHGQYSFFGKFLRGKVYKNIISRLERYSFQRADLIVSVTASLAQYAHDKSSRKTTALYVENATDKQNIITSALADDIFKTRKKLGLACEEKYFYFCHVGTLTPWDNLDILIKSIAESKYLELLRLVIVGTGSEERRLKILVETCGVQNNVIFVSELPRVEALEYVKAADVVPLLKHKFTYGLSPIKYYEALGLGKYVMATNIPHIDQAAKIGMGETVNFPFQQEDILLCIEKLYEKREKIRNLTLKIAKYATSHHTWEERCRKILNFFYGKD